jgi:hypothetical protein
MKRSTDTNTQSLKRSVSNVQKYLKRSEDLSLFAQKNVKVSEGKCSDLQRLGSVSNAGYPLGHWIISSKGSVNMSVRSKLKLPVARALEKQLQKLDQLKVSLDITFRPAILLDQKYVKNVASKVKLKEHIGITKDRLMFGGFVALVTYDGINQNQKALPIESNCKYSGKKSEVIHAST